MMYLSHCLVSFGGGKDLLVTVVLKKTVKGDQRVCGGRVDSKGISKSGICEMPKLEMGAGIQTEFVSNE